MTFFKSIFERHNIFIDAVSPLSGGDINEVYKVKAGDKIYVIKLNQASLFPDMFQKEVKSLKILDKTQSFIIPKVLACDTFEGKTYLIMDYIHTVQKRDFSESFAECLAKLHRHQSQEYGLGFDNFIGRLPQYNKPQTKDPIDFYINLRLEPQFKMALKQGYRFKDIDTFYKNLEHIIPKEKASLIHGDLWSGNFLITSQSQPCIYDPAIAYASREMDLAMMKLFGGFPQAVFDTYNEIFPLENNWEDRVELWQLYYILVHVNLFGASYFASAERILAKYSA